MLKNILNLNGAQELSKSEQKIVTGGIRYIPDPTCVCGKITYGVHLPNQGGIIPLTEKNATWGTIIPTGYVLIYPAPECCGV